MSEDRLAAAAAELGIDTTPPAEGSAKWFAEAIGVRMVGDPEAPGDLPDYLSVLPSGQFGNNVIQLANAVCVAKQAGLAHVCHPFDWFSGSGPVAPRLVLGEAPMEGGWGIETSFFMPSRVRGLTDLHPADFVDAVRNHLKPALALPTRRYIPAEAVVHMRGGGIFKSPRPHPAYVQPPLVFFTSAIERLVEQEGVRKIRLVHQDDSNPLVGALIDWAKARRIPLTPQSTNPRGDAANILVAEHLIVGLSSFATSLALMSDTLQSIHIFRDCHTLTPLVWHVPVSTLWSDAGDYIPPRGWHNTPEQRVQMLAYPATSLSMRVLQPGPKGDAMRLETALAGR